MTQMTPFRHICMANGCQIQNQRTMLPWKHKNPKKWHMTSSKVIDLWWPRLTSERSRCQCKPWMSPPYTHSCPHHQHKCRSSQVSGVETVRNAKFAWHDFGNQLPSIGLFLGHAGNFVPPWKKCHNWKLLQISKGSVLFFGMDGLSWSWRNEKHVKIRIMLFS